MMHATAIPAIQRPGAHAVVAFATMGMAACVHREPITTRAAQVIESVFARYSACNLDERLGDSNLLSQKWFRKTFAGDRLM